MARPVDRQLAARQFMDALYGAEPSGSLIEVRRTRDRGGMAQRWFGVREVEQALDHIWAVGFRHDVYVGVAPRTRRAGSRDAIQHAHCLWADVDGADTLDALRRFSPRPSIFVESGSPDCGHAYWSLLEPVSCDELERANRRLAYALGADPRSTDAARILRAPGSSNWKHAPPAPVEIVHLEAEVFTLEQVAGDLPDPPARRARRGASSSPLGGRRDLSELRSVDAALLLIERYAADAELRAGGDGRLHGRCPFPDHEDRNPSFALNRDGSYICACRGSGDIVRLFVELRGDIFTDRNLPLYVRELHDELGIAFAIGQAAA